MHANKSFNRNPANHRLHHALMETLIKDENAMDKGVADTVKDHKRKHDNDEDPPAGPNQGKKIKRRRIKESESSKKSSTTKETPKDKTPTKGSKTGKSASAKEPVEEPIAEVIMDDAGEDVVHDDDQPQATSEPKTRKTLNPDWFMQPPRPPTPDPERKKCTCSSNIEIEYNFQECFNALTNKLDWNNPEGDRYPFDLSKHLPLQGPLDMLLLAIQHKLFHLDRSDIVDFIVALRMFTRSLILKRRVKDLQLGVESYQSKLNITKPQKTFPEIESKKLHSIIRFHQESVYEGHGQNRKSFCDCLSCNKFTDGYT
ncbi:hypothetical protein Tco_0486372 [Tanacetum coccineum]